MNIDFKKRQHVSRVLAAWHLVRYGSLVYGMGFRGPVVMIGPLRHCSLVKNCHFECDPSIPADRPVVS